MLAIRAEGESVSFTIRVTPRAAANALAGVRDGVLLVRVTAPPVEGKANAAVIALLARALDVPRGEIRLERGAAARTKLVRLPSRAAAALTRLK